MQRVAADPALLQGRVCCRAGPAVEGQGLL